VARILKNLDEVLNILLIFQLTLPITPKLKYKLLILAAVFVWFGNIAYFTKISTKLVAHIFLYLLYTVHTQ